MSDDLISREAAIDEIEGVDWYHQNKNGEMVHGANSKEHQPWYKSQDIYKALKAVPAVDAVPVIRCKYCKHRPTGENRDDLEFPDETCPCQCEDFWYNWKPADNWFCGNGERKDGERHEG